MNNLGVLHDTEITATLKKKLPKHHMDSILTIVLQYRVNLCRD